MTKYYGGKQVKMRKRRRKAAQGCLGINIEGRSFKEGDRDHSECQKKKKRELNWTNHLGRQKA
jgi:hypothetical protein